MSVLQKIGPFVNFMIMYYYILVPHSQNSHYLSNKKSDLACFGDAGHFLVSC